MQYQKRYSPYNQTKIMTTSTVFFVEPAIKLLLKINV